ncbi:hypothetical protein [Actinacidiphila glaucinigra]|uniref:hypothetical protein n=1 Tax=Actinacidiphila glaucinigra TaxID=235986 RepID=UPI0036730617
MAFGIGLTAVVLGRRTPAVAHGPSGTGGTVTAVLGPDPGAYPASPSPAPAGDRPYPHARHAAER